MAAPAGDVSTISATAVASAVDIAVANAVADGVADGVADALADGAANNAPIGIFDSGVGGLSVLRHIRAQLPHEHLLYVADSGFAPYGDKPEHIVAERSLSIADYLVARGAKALVVACNTATVAAIKALRLHYPDMPIVGVEPGLKPAAAASRSGKVGVLATDVTLHGAKFLALREQVSAASNVTFLLQPCVGLVDQIELGDLGASDINTMLKRYITPLLAQGADTIVLGCTHYPLVRASIEAVIAGATDAPVTLIDTGDAVARQLARLLTQAGLLRSGAGHGADAGADDRADVSGANIGAATLEAFTSASATALSTAFSNLVGLTPPVSQVAFPVPALTAFPAPV